MCTLTWLADRHCETAAAGRDRSSTGYLIWFNRDERHTRAVARPPERRARDGIGYLAPVDGDFGGTWIGVNERGLSVAILNRYEESPVGPASGTVSRGLLVAAALAQPSPGRLTTWLRAHPLSDYQPFTLATTAPGDPIVVHDWTGRELTALVHERPGMVRTSSGRDQAEAERVRTATWNAMAAEAGALSLDLAERFHRSHLPARGPFSVCMHREEAATQSLTVIDVGAGVAVMTYVPGPPCVTTARVVESLALSGGPTPL